MKEINFLKDRANHVKSLIDNINVHDAITFADIVFRTKQTNNKIIFVGNGASNTIATHAALDYMSQTGVNTVSMNDAAVLTAFSNDFGYEEAIERFVRINLNKGDTLVCVSSSGNSPNVVNAAKWAYNNGNYVISFTGFDKDNKLGQTSNLNFWVDSNLYNPVECTHNSWLAIIADLLIERMGDSVGAHGINIK